MQWHIDHQAVKLTYRHVFLSLFFPDYFEMNAKDGCPIFKIKFLFRNVVCLHFDQIVPLKTHHTNMTFADERFISSVAFKGDFLFFYCSKSSRPSEASMTASHLRPGYPPGIFFFSASQSDSLFVSVSLTSLYSLQWW